MAASESHRVPPAHGNALHLPTWRRPRYLPATARLSPVERCSGLARGSTSLQRLERPASIQALRRPTAARCQPTSPHAGSEAALADSRVFRRHPLLENGCRHRLAYVGTSVAKSWALREFSVLGQGPHHDCANLTTGLARDDAPADQWRRTKLATEAEANESSRVVLWVRRQMKSGSQEASFEIKPGEVREGNADDGLKVRVGWAAQPDRGGRNDWGAV